MKFTNIAILLSVIILSYAPTITTSSIAILSTAEASTKLGDLSKFKKIAIDVNVLVQKGDLAKAKIRIKDLEKTWDEVEAGIKPRASTDWHVLDKAIDHALSALREDKPNLNDCKNATTKLIETFDKLER